MLLETKEVLEDQLAGWRARSDKIHQLEKHNLLLKARVHDMEQVRCLHTKKSPLRDFSLFNSNPTGGIFGPLIFFLHTPPSDIIIF